MTLGSDKTASNRTDAGSCNKYGTCLSSRAYGRSAGDRSARGRMDGSDGSNGSNE